MFTRNPDVVTRRSWSRAFAALPGVDAHPLILEGLPLWIWDALDRPLDNDSLIDSCPAPAADVATTIQLLVDSGVVCDVAR